MQMESRLLQALSTGTGEICSGDGCYDVNMVDSWGDGWNGNVLTIGDSNFELYQVQQVLLH